MRIPRLTWAGGPEEDREIWLDPAQARHGVSVLRLKAGDLVEVAGPAGLARARVVTARGGRSLCLGLVLEESWRSAGEALHGPGIRLALAIIKLPRFDWAVEKAAELGAGEIWPLVCERVKPGLARAALARAERWQRLAEEARKQCGRARPLVVRPPATPAEILAEAGPAPAGFFLSPRAATGVSDDEAAGARSDLWVLVGPEGGFSPGEEAAFMAAGLRPWRLGPLTLRAETAALAALALLLTVPG
ncbi:MAG: 16S rRNA (uracil(1498)-N(3))-methyltransferase [Candidatus Adiutrix sp.]|jgi:16S rRNA (uracil1498-N3)-methyltransferase|nr:16S rRNA (uracil(1498)-N(3))-methyltransferase [Candidatus Adiutrix sp.]